MTDQVDIVELLERDHRSIDELVARLDDVDDPIEMRGLYLRICEELSAHEEVEQQVLFPAFRAAAQTAPHAAGGETLTRRMGEHEELNELLAEIRALAPDGLAFTKRASALILEIDRHFRLEEETVFSRVRSMLGDAELRELGRHAEGVKRHSPAFPDEHPKIAPDR